MNRRNFLSLLSGAAVAPLVPASALASGGVIPPGPWRAVEGVNGFMMERAVGYTREVATRFQVVSLDIASGKVAGRREWDGVSKPARNEFLKIVEKVRAPA